MVLVTGSYILRAVDGVRMQVNATRECIWTLICEGYHKHNKGIEREGGKRIDMITDTYVRHVIVSKSISQPRLMDALQRNLSSYVIDKLAAWKFNPSLLCMANIMTIFTKIARIRCFNWNKVFVTYCDRSSFNRDVDDVDPMEGKGLKI
ncbi:Uncharacterized protein Adt_13607 [Abeliophyllum distichum]|uniref:Uncharacterized protein n=1 Tax=Abeliophyllum distichum TaxID=126358 RepID=A0ABD1TX96_9LAMI